MTTANTHASKRRMGKNCIKDFKIRCILYKQLEPSFLQLIQDGPDHPKENLSGLLEQARYPFCAPQSSVKALKGLID